MVTTGMDSAVTTGAASGAGACMEAEDVKCLQREEKFDPREKHLKQQVLGTGGKAGRTASGHLLTAQTYAIWTYVRFKLCCCCIPVVGARYSAPAL